MRQAGRAVADRPQTPLGSSGAGTALLTADEDSDLKDLRFTSGLRLTPAFGIQVGARRRSGHDVPAFGSAEHSALLTGSLDLTELEQAPVTGPLVGFAPIVLDPRGPSPEDVDPEPAPPASATRVLPSRRSLRAANGSAKGRPLAEDLLPGSGSSSRGVTLLRPSGRASGALRAKDVERALADATHKARTSHDPTPTGELARPFVHDAVAADWALDDVPPPVSVDVFQRAMRAGLALDDPEGLKALDEGADVGGASRRAGRSRRELRARERATTSTRSVTARRLAKGGVLAITALGVVSSATPQGLSALGLAKDGAPTRNMVDFAGALEPDVSAPVLSDLQVQQMRRAAVSDHLRTELSEAQAADAVHAGVQAGGALAELAKQQDDQVMADRRAREQRAIRDAATDPRGYARMYASQQYGWGDAQFQCLNLLWNRESGWNYRATNASSGAYGIAQALPGSKMNSVGADWRTNPITQMKWGLNYIEDRYGTPCGAWSHSQATGWY